MNERFLSTTVSVYDVSCLSQTRVWASVSQGPLSPLPLWTPSAPKGQSGPFGFPDPRGPLLTGRHLGFASIGLPRPMVWMAALHERGPLRKPRRILSGAVSTIAIGKSSTSLSDDLRSKTSCPRRRASNTSAPQPIPVPPAYRCPAQ